VLENGARWRKQAEKALKESEEKMKPKIKKLDDIPPKAVGGHDGFSARSLLNRPDKEIEIRLLDGTVGSKGPIPAHRHAETHLVIVLAGRLELEVNDEVFAVPEGHCAEIPPNQTHQLRCAGDAPMKFLAVKWK